MTKDNKNVSGAAAIVMAGLVASRITGFLRQTLVPNILGSTSVGDAYDFAFRISDLMFYLLVGGAISAALIPVLTGYLAKDDEVNGWKAVSTFINAIIIIMLAAVTLGVLFAPKIVPVIAIGYRIDTDREQLELVVRLTRILLPSVGFLMLAGMSNGILNSYNRFAAAAFGPVLYNIFSAMSIYFLNKYSVESIAIGVMFSSMLYFLFQLSFAWKNLKHYKLRLNLRHRGFRRMFGLAIPSLISSSITQVNVFITSMFTTLFASGSIVALNLADRIWQMPYGIFAQGMGTAMLPTMSAKHATGDASEYKRILNKGLRTVMLLSIPSAAGLVALRNPIINFFRFSNMFDSESMATAQNILMYFTIALLAQCFVTILIRAFYAINDTKTPLFTGLSMVILNILLSTMFYRYTSLGAGGMALAYSLASSANALLLIFIIDRKTGSIGLTDLLRFLLRISAASVVMFMVLLLYNNAFDFDTIILDFEALNFLDTTKAKLAQFLSIMLKITIGAVVYFFIIISIKVEEGIYMMKVIAEKLKLEKVLNGILKKYSEKS